MRKYYFALVIALLSLNLRPAITALGPLLGIIKQDLEMSSISASLLTTLPVFCMGFFSLLAVKLNRRLTIEHSLTVAMGLIFLSLLSRLFIHTSWLLITSAFFAGMGIGIAGPLITGLIKKHYPDHNYFMSFYSVSMVVGAAMAASSSIPLYHYFKQTWRWPLGLWSLLALVAGLFLLPLTKISPLDTEKSVDVNQVPTGKKGNWLLMVFFSLMAGVFYAITAWLAPYVQSLGYSQQTSGLILTLFTVIQIPVSFSISLIVSWTKRPTTWLLICGGTQLIGLVLLLLGFSPWLVTIFLGIGAGGLFPLALMLPMTQSETASEAISLSAFMQSGGFMLGSLGPFFFGIASEEFDSFKPAWLIITTLVIGMILTILAIRQNSLA